MTMYVDSLYELDRLFGDIGMISQLSSDGKNIMGYVEDQSGDNVSGLVH